MLRQRHWERLLAALAFLCAASVCFAAELNIFELKKSTFQPIALHACRVALSDATLECTSDGKTLPTCYATNEPFLCTLALCLQKHSQNVSQAQIDSFWSEYAAGWADNQQQPGTSYLQALDAAGSPTRTIGRHGSITEPSWILEDDYQRAYRSVSIWLRSESSQVMYSYVHVLIV
jgi:hypothetical protein